MFPRWRRDCLAKWGQQKARLSRKIVPLVEELKEDLKRLKEEIKCLQKALNWATDEFKELKRSQINATEELNDATEKIIQANQEIDLLQRRNIKLEAQSRRNNIQFFNVKENEADSSFKEKETVLKKLLVD